MKRIITMPYRWCHKLETAALAARRAARRRVPDPSQRLLGLVLAGGA